MGTIVAAAFSLLFGMLGAGIWVGLTLMATGVLYALPPAAIYYAFKRYMVSGLTAGAVKS